ncbi:unnamed protein product [Parnassius apollo]|uniref:(apollo) hypothetical protein n=1 Tax=Parnassius apollo TaxID=110799 RepID=A0A8S3W0U6_PARAO|nr:unnamed protein product [Parnassius apollo]
MESALKTRTRLYTPQDYIDVMTSCRKRNKLTATKMECLDFVGVYKMMKTIVKRKKDIEGNAISWLKTKEINIFKNRPDRIFLSTCRGGQTHEVDLNKRPKRGSINNPLTLSRHYEQLWPQGKPISQPKLDDIKSLLHLIPSDATKYYENLTGARDLKDDVEGFDGSIDFEVEDKE